MRYVKYYDYNHDVAYGPDDSGALDHLFIWTVRERPDHPDDHRDSYDNLKDLLVDWNHAAGNTTPFLHRSVFFCNQFDKSTIRNDLFNLAGEGFFHFFGKLNYWFEGNFTNGNWPDASFPNFAVNDRTAINIGDINLAFDTVGDRPSLLDDFIITSVKSKGFHLNCGLSFKLDRPAKRTSSARTNPEEISPATVKKHSWSVDSIAGSDELVVWLDNDGEFAAGAIGLAIKSPIDSEHSTLLQRNKINFAAAPTTAVPAPINPCRIWSSRLISSVKAAKGDAAYFVLLDPRDSKKPSGWMGQGELNSRLLFGTSKIRSNFFSPKGSSFVLVGTASAATRFALLLDKIDANGNMSSDLKIIFRPEGHFKIVSPAEEPEADRSLKIHNRDLIAGVSATEFFDPGPATHIHFDKNQPAFFVEGDENKLLDTRIVTSFVRFSDGTHILPTDFHSQPAEAALFQGAIEGHVPRRRVPYLKANTDAFPVFLHAGYEEGEADYDGIVAFETTHLARYRRLNKIFANSFREETTTLSITPQGILAEVTDTGLYSTLYFGNTTGVVGEPDFALTISPSSSIFYGDLQRALSASQLFMVISDPTSDGLAIIQPSAYFNVRDFSFSLLEKSPFLNRTEMAAGALIIKYFKGMTLEELVRDPKLWACSDFLAPNASSESIENLANLSSSSDYLQPLRDAWHDPNWQGVIALHLPLSKKPAIIDALGPGFDGAEQKRKPELFAPFFGFNALAVTKAALEVAGSPSRPGSTFGAVHYQHALRHLQKDAVAGRSTDRTRDRISSATRDWPVLNDEEPTDAGNPDLKVRVYGLTVQELTISFTRGQISHFSAEVDLAFSHIFWDKLDTPATLVLIGHYEKRGDEDIFSLACDTPLTVPFEDGAYLRQITISRAQLNVVSVVANELTAFIGLDGTVDLIPITALSLFTFKAIRLNSFGFEYTFDKLNFSFFKFGFKPHGIAADIDFSEGALKTFLPVKLKGMTLALGNKLLSLRDLNFVPLTLDGGNTTSDFQFGLLMEFDFGSLGQLAGDLRGLRVPLLLGWRGGAGRGLAFGIQFPTFDGHLDIGIQQFIRLRAKELNIQPCPPHSNSPTMIGIQAKDAQVVMLGHEWPSNAATHFSIFIPVTSGRKPSWAFGAQYGDCYIGGGYRIDLPRSTDNSVETILDSFKGARDLDGDLCQLAARAEPQNDGWSIAGGYRNIEIIDVGIAISDPYESANGNRFGTYGIRVVIPPFGGLDVLYRRVNAQVGIFSLEYSLPDVVRTMQFGVASVRLPVFRLEIHTDGGFLVDFGFPWNNDFARSAQVEIVIFVGSGGFYFGGTSATTSKLLQFERGYGYSPPTDAELDRNFKKTVRLGFAARVGIGRSFTIGILSANASLTIFGGLEGATSYRSDADLFSPTLYALRGFVGLMVDISATVDFVIIRASVRILAYVDVGLQIQQLLAKKDSDGQLYLVRPPVLIFADINITVAISIEIHLGCFSVVIPLSFSANWHYEERLSGFREIRPFTARVRAPSGNMLAAPVFGWNANYRYWQAARELTVYATVLPCMADAADVGESGQEKTCAVGVMLMDFDQKTNGFGDFTKFLLGWLLLYDVDPTQYEAHPLSLDRVLEFQELMRDPKKAETFWQGFADALLIVVKNQFEVTLDTLDNFKGTSLLTIPPWPDSSFAYVRPSKRAGIVSVVNSGGRIVSASDSAFVDYCRHLIATTLPEIRHLIDDPRDRAHEPDNPKKAMIWSEIWDSRMFETLH